MLCSIALIHFETQDNSILNQVNDGSLLSEMSGTMSDHLLFGNGPSVRHPHHQRTHLCPRYGQDLDCSSPLREGSDWMHAWTSSEDSLHDL